MLLLLSYSVLDTSSVRRNSFVTRTGAESMDSTQTVTCSIGGGGGGGGGGGAYSHHQQQQQHFSSSNFLGVPKSCDSPALLAVPGSSGGSSGIRLTTY